MRTNAHRRLFRAARRRALAAGLAAGLAAAFALTAPALGVATPLAAALDASWAKLAEGAPAALPPWPCAAPDGGALEDFRGFLARLEGWSKERGSRSLDDLERDLGALLDVRAAAVAAPCYRNALIGDTLTRVAVVALVERIAADRSAVGRLRPVAERLTGIEPSLADLDALGRGAGITLPPAPADCATSPACYRERFASSMRAAARDRDAFWDNLRPSDVGAEHLLESPSLAHLLFRIQATDDLIVSTLLPLVEYAASLPAAANDPSAGERALPDPPAERARAAPSAAGRPGSKLNDPTGSAAAVVARTLGEVRSGVFALRRGFDLSPAALLAARAASLRVELATERATIRQYEPVPLELRITNPGGMFPIVRPTPWPSALGDGSPYPVAVRIRRPDGRIVEGVRRAPAGRFDERITASEWLLAVPPGSSSIALPVSAERARLDRPLFDEPGEYRIAVSLRPVPAGEPEARRLAPTTLAIEGEVVITVTALAAADRSCRERIAADPRSWMLDDPDGVYLATTSLADLKAAREWVEGLRAGCATSLFRPYLDLARLAIERRISDRHGVWRPTPQDLDALANLAELPSFSYRAAARALAERGRHRGETP